ncbi:hypothetical protein VXQ18_05450 [Brucella abortus]|nr:hypothetical protein [Brucella abortus]
MRALSEKVSRRLKAGEIAGRTIVLKLKTQDFKLRTRNRQLGDPTQLADRIFRTGLQLLEKGKWTELRFRLLGIGVSDLSPSDRADPPDLVDIPGHHARCRGAPSTGCATNSASMQLKPATLFPRAIWREHKHQPTAIMNLDKFLKSNSYNILINITFYFIS